MTDRSVGAGRDGRLQEIIRDLEEAVAVKEARQFGVCASCGIDHDNTARLHRAAFVLILKRLRLLAVPDPLASDTGQGEPERQTVKQFVHKWAHTSRLQTFEDRERFRTEAHYMLADLAAPLASSSAPQGGRTPQELAEALRRVWNWLPERFRTSEFCGVMDELSASSVPVRASGAPQTEQRIREYLWLTHGHQGQYGDDGEMQCSACAPVWDYRRMPLGKLVEQAFKVREERVIAALIKAQASASPSDDGA